MDLPNGMFVGSVGVVLNDIWILYYGMYNNVGASNISSEQWVIFGYWDDAFSTE